MVLGRPKTNTHIFPSEKNTSHVKKFRQGRVVGNIHEVEAVDSRLGVALGVNKKKRKNLPS